MEIVRGELARPAPEDARILSDWIRNRHGAAVAAVLYYGSCLRKNTTEDGVLDFYVLVDSYAAVYDSRALVWGNMALPPNVFLLELPHAGRTLRCKYAVMTVRDFRAAAEARCLHSIIWGRFSQPSVAVWLRDETVRSLVELAVAEAVVTMVEHAATLLPGAGDKLDLAFEDLWQQGFGRTYSSEFRTEKPETIRQLYDADRSRYNRAAAAALREMALRGRLFVDELGLDGARLRWPAGDRSRIAHRWRSRLPRGKVAYVGRLLKSAWTFGDWVPYALWKLERQTGMHIEVSERQRRHPFVFGWPALVRVLLSKQLK